MHKWSSSYASERVSTTVVSNTLMVSGVLSGNRHHGRGLVLCDPTVWRDLVCSNTLECTE